MESITFKTRGANSRGRSTIVGKTTFGFYDRSEQPVAITGTANGIGSANGSYRYDGHFKRVKQQVNGNTIYSVYDRAGALVHLDSVTAGEMTDYIAGPQGTLARIKNNVITYLHHDILGSAQSGTNSSGVVQWREQYSPFGEELQGISANADQAGYTDPNGESPVCFFTPWSALACIGVAAAGYGVYKFGEKTEDLKNSKLREMEADTLRQEAYINCVRSGGRGSGGIASSERELAERRRDTLKDAAEAAKAGCIIGTTCGGSLPRSTEENAVNGLLAIWNWITGGDEQEEQEPPEHPVQEERR